MRPRFPKGRRGRLVFAIIDAQFDAEQIDATWDFSAKRATVL
jgi:hypothetical protein